MNKTLSRQIEINKQLQSSPKPVTRIPDKPGRYSGLVQSKKSEAPAPAPIRNFVVYKGKRVLIATSQPKPVEAPAQVRYRYSGPPTETDISGISEYQLERLPGKVNTNWDTWRLVGQKSKTSIDKARKASSKKVLEPEALTTVTVTPEDLIPTDTYRLAVEAGLIKPAAQIVKKPAQVSKTQAHTKVKYDKFGYL
jgi:hypothetical protein